VSVRRRLLILAQTLLLSASPGAAQTLVWERQNPNPGSPYGGGQNFGFTLWAIQDCNGDGFTDVLVSDPYSPNFNMSFAGYVGIFSGTNGATIREWHGTGSYQHLSAFGTTGDADGDGAGDFVIGWSIPGSFFATLVSGATGAFLPSVNLGTDGVFPVGDVNQDGFGDFTRRAGGVGGSPGGFEVLAGPDGAAVLYAKTLPQYQAWLGRPVVRIPDQDGDLVNDLLVGAPGNYCCPAWTWGCPGYGFIPLVGQAFIFSGATGVQLQQFTGTALCDRFGLGLAAPDLNGDGVVEIVIGASGTSQMSVFSPNGTLIGGLPFQGFPSGGLLPLEGLGDVNGDGTGDYAVSFLATREVKVFDGSGSLLYDLTANPGTSGDWYFGCSIASLGDVNGDGFPDLAIGMPYTGGPLNGRVRVYSLGPAGVSLYGSGCPQPSGVGPSLVASGPALQGQPLTLQLLRVGLGLPCALALGFSNTTYGSIPLPWDLGAAGYPGCQLLTSIDQFLSAQTVQLSPGVSGAAFSIPIPVSIFLHGFPFYAQAAVEPFGTPASIATTRGLKIVIQ
jgi:FG-GAP repeat